MESSFAKWNCCKQRLYRFAMSFIWKGESVRQYHVAKIPSAGHQRFGLPYRQQAV
jgi:hypothetical protein